MVHHLQVLCSRMEGIYIYIKKHLVDLNYCFPKLANWEILHFKLQKAVSKALFSL